MHMVDLISMDDAICFFDNFGRAIVNGNEESMHRQCMDSLIARIGSNLKPLAVCAHCDLHTPRKLKQCPCKRGFYFCGKACQLAHWDAGHADTHADDVD
jgi:hypothetical protein